LNDALNYNRSRIKGTFVEIMKKSKANVIPFIIFGLLTFVYGFSIFYVMPLSLVSMKLSLLLGIFLFILFGLLIGLTLMAINFQRFVEIALTYIALCWEKQSMKLLVTNNLKTHSMRNKLTSAIFSMALAFNIFIMVQFRLIIMQTKQKQIADRGSFPFINANGSPVNKFDPEGFDPVLRNLSSKIDSITWVPFVADRSFEKKGS